MEIHEIAYALQSELVALRRDLHRHPELSMREFATTRKIAAILDAEEVPYRLTEPTGLVAEICGTGGRSEQCVLLRADMDALPVKEETELPFASENDGVMHACGHDFHIAMLVGGVKILQRLRNQFSGTVRCVFQPAEEIGTGAELMLSQGAAKGAGMGMALHVFGSYAPHQAEVTVGPAAAATDLFRIEITGKSCHGAHPQTGADATYAAAAILVQLQSMVSREFPPTDPVVVTVGTLHSGTKGNIISGSAVMEGTCRSFSKKVWAVLPQVMERIVQETAAALRCEAEVTFERVTKPLICDKDACGILAGAVRKVLPDPALYREGTINMGGEDFAAFGDAIPITWLKLGGGSPYPMHSSRVYLDEDILKTGAACYAQFAVDALEFLNIQSNQSHSA